MVDQVRTRRRLASLLSPFMAGRTRVLAVGMVMLGFAVVETVGDLMATHSFNPPFTEVLSDGSRTINKEYWAVGGTAVVNQNFVRITPDRQSKKGAIWSHRPLACDNFTTTVKFRIHGQGKKFFGDGMALWLMQHSYWQEGDLHGVRVPYTGVGIVFDTFKNTEYAAKHRDVSIYVNDGKQTLEQVKAKFEGCDANVRYHGERADFDITNSTKAKITVEGRTLSVMVDSKASGNWFACATVDLTDILPEGWLQKAHLGITATTGQLADNHDVMSIYTYDDIGFHPEADEEVRVPKFGRGANMTMEDRLDRIEDALSGLMTVIEQMQLNNEHQLVAVQDHITNTIKKLQAQEDKSEQRISTLEKQITDQVQGKMDQRLTHLEQSLQTTIGRKVAMMENTIQSKVGTEKVLTEISKTIEAKTSGWKWPFFFILALVVLCMGVLYRWYQRLLKSHLL